MPILNAIESGCDFSIHSKAKYREDGRPSEDIAIRQAYPKSAFQHMSPQALGARLWSAYRILDKRYQQSAPLQNDGTTASTTIVYGNTIITATLSDTVLFAAAWDTQDKLIGVKQLSRLHILSSDVEERRIQAIGVNHTISKKEIIKNYKAGQINLEHGPIIYCQDDGGKKTLLSLVTPKIPMISLTRSIGDCCFKPAVIPDANIDVATISSLLKHFNVKAFGTLLLIKTSDGFTDAAVYNEKTYEDYLAYTLRWMFFNKTNEKKIAEHLVNCAALISDDDITVSIQAIVKQNKRTDFNGLFGVYDGHGGDGAAIYTANNVSPVLNELLALSEDEYAAHEDSTYRHQQAYYRDNANSYQIIQQEEQEEAEDERIVPEHATNRMQLMLQLMLVVLLSAGVAAGLKISITRRLIDLFLNKNDCRAYSTFGLFAAVCLSSNMNGTDIEQSEQLDSAAAYGY